MADDPNKYPRSVQNILIVKPTRERVEEVLEGMVKVLDGLRDGLAPWDQAARRILLEAKMPIAALPLPVDSSQD